ncbi:MAG: primosomal protein N' [Puniceicoccales bacterium]|jgi:primosomal protein N' (replication factor Y)|nr:primosomal protein N' [Puniceicoccales bacterium]
METLCAEILTFGIFDKPLLYRVPQELEQVLLAGMFVQVPFGKSKTFGVVVKIYTTDTSQSPYKIKDVFGISYDSPLIGKDLIDLIFWMGKYYAAPHRTLLETIIPVAIRRNVPAKFSTNISLIKTLSQGECETLQRRSPKQYLLYQFLLNSGKSVAKSELKKFSPSALASLLTRGIVGEEFEKINRIAYGDWAICTPEKGKNTTLTEEQIYAAEDIGKSLGKGQFNTHLLHGITGSGKTEVYLDAIRRVLNSGGDVIYLVPELALTPQTVSRIRLGVMLAASQVVVWHSGLSEGERRDAWLAMANGEARIVIGARSAVFAPLKNVKIIIVDEEHETTYKQAETPRYHARDVAVYRTKLCNATCILGSATPSVESLFNVLQKKYKLNVLKKRIDGSRLPKIETIDMRYERSLRTQKIISSRLEELIEGRLASREQIILFLNKRGYSSTVFCNSCDYVAICPHCSTSLTYHRPQNLLRCHICDYVEALPSKCPKCGGNDILQTGVGTQKLASVIGEMFPNASIERIDSDTMATRDNFYKILTRFGNGEIDILIGTQMISKGLDFPNVSLVGIINVDNAMNFPDFRANERVFQSIIQVSGRAGRGSKPGVVAIQTRCPNSELLRLAMANDCESFLQNELAERREFFYPPFSHIIRLVFAGENEVKTEYFAKIFCSDLKNRSESLFEIRGPSPAVIQKANDRFRFSLLCFSRNAAVALEKIRESIDSLKKTNAVGVAIDVDPVDMM